MLLIVVLPLGGLAAAVYLALALRHNGVRRPPD
jgi:hypothetical protein